MLRELRTTADGSQTIFVPQWDEHYHSIHGAIQESRHVFINNGLIPFLSESVVRILEIGFGTGLNALLTAEYATQGRSIYYEALEAYPIEDTLWQSLNYHEIANSELNLPILHRANWEISEEVLPNFTLKKRSGFLETITFEESFFDLIYFDAFAPGAQPELWTPFIFTKMYQALKPGGHLVTYCAKGSVKRAMKEVGFQVLALPGPPRKREMTKAVKPE
jgi:tRNA U34 5-methylaminomethyl-2-thiouridine-forming methyltransferase MnmC